MEKTKDKKLKILVGDDQIGIIGSQHQKSFLLSYGHLAHFDFEDKVDEFIRKTIEYKHDAVLIDLHWENADNDRRYKTGLRILGHLIEYDTPAKVLHTSDEENRERGYCYGADFCIQKYLPVKELEELFNEIQNLESMKEEDRNKR